MFFIIDGLAGVCSSDGQHLAIMPHPERCVQYWQWPYTPPEWGPKPTGMSPWFNMFTNAYRWGRNNQ